MNQKMTPIPVSHLLRQMQGVGAKTQESYRSLVYNLTLHFGREPRLDELTPQACARFAQWLATRVKATSAATYLAKLSRLLRHAHRQGLLPYDPAEMPALRPPHTVPRDPRFLTLDELRALLAVPCPHAETRRAFLFAVCTGLRLSDIETLRSEHIVCQGGKAFVVKRQVKTGKTVRVPLTRQAQELLRTAPQAAPSEPLFRLHSRTTVASDLRRWAEAAGLAEPVTFHTARHTYATLCLQAGVDIHVISRLCGHSSVAVTQRYAHLVDPVYCQAADKFSTLLARGALSTLADHPLLE